MGFEGIDSRVEQSGLGGVLGHLALQILLDSEGLYFREHIRVSSRAATSVWEPEVEGRGSGNNESGWSVSRTRAHTHVRARTLERAPSSPVLGRRGRGKRATDMGPPRLNRRHLRWDHGAVRDMYVTMTVEHQRNFVTGTRPRHLARVLSLDPDGGRWNLARFRRISRMALGRLGLGPCGPPGTAQRS